MFKNAKVDYLATD